MTKLFSCDNAASLLDQRQQQTQRLFTQPDPEATLSQLARIGIDLEHERLLTVDLDYGEERSVPALELGVTRVFLVAGKVMQSSPYRLGTPRIMLAVCGGTVTQVTVPVDLTIVPTRGGNAT